MSTIVSDKELNVFYLPSNQLERLQKSADLFDVILVTPPFNRHDKTQPYKFNDSKSQIEYLESVNTWLDEAIRHLNKHGSLLVYSIPRWLPYFAEFLSSKMTFKYWIAIKNPDSLPDSILMHPYHEGVLVFVKDRNRFTLNKVRYPHIFCSQCGDYIADWGGKKHLRPQYGPVISDVWDDRDDFIDQDYGLSPITLDRLLDLTCKNNFRVLIAMHDGKPYDGSQLYLPSLGSQGTTPQNGKISINNRQVVEIFPKDETEPEDTRFRADEIFIGDSIKIMSSWVSDPKARFDLIFADPPYNLEKNYGKLDDNLKDQEYISWCDQWLDLCTQLLKPYGTLYVLNLPKWSIFHATFLSNRLWFQRWIAWDALSDPRGNVMPAHYGLLMYTNHPTKYTYNPIPDIPKMDQCLRPKCIASRPPDVPREELSDIWYDVHRIKHKRDRDEHPCQLPVKLLERIIQISSNPGDTILDPFLGTGTTAIVAKKYGRHYVGLDIDAKYREIAKAKLDAIDLQEPLSFMPSLAHSKSQNYQLSLFD
jgi:site-specific DNA-methyltransferase (adenine-specific)